MTANPSRLAAAAVGLALGVLLAPAPLPAADPDQPHEHRGVLAPYEPGPLNIELDEEQQERLAEGKLVIFTVESETGGVGVGVQDIAAPPEVVWSRITGFDHYVEWVGPVKECEVYRTDGPKTYTRVKVSGFLYSYEYFLENTLHPEHDMLTWTLDYDRRSDFDDCVGAWAVKPHPDKEGWSRAWFSSDLELRSKMPGFLMDYVKKKGLKDATAWVKRESEKAAGG
jgi:hypothetical protein